MAITAAEKKARAERLRWARQRRPEYPSAEAFAAAAKVLSGTYRHHENGTRTFDLRTAQKYARLLKVNALWLYAKEGQPDTPVLQPSKQKVVKAPLVSWVAAGQLAYSPDLIPVLEFESFVETTYYRETIIALTVQGGSMNRRAPHGSTIIVDVDDRTLREGSYYVIRVGDETTFKRYRLKGGPARFEPDSTEPDHPTIFPDKDVAIVGRVVRVIHDL